MYEELVNFVARMQSNKYEITIYVASGSEGLDSIAVGYIYRVSSDFIALGRTPDTYSWIIPMDKILMIEISGTPKD